jgi:hypothetical protein
LAARRQTGKICIVSGREHGVGRMKFSRGLIWSGCCKDAGEHCGGGSPVYLADEALGRGVRGGEELGVCSEAQAADQRLRLPAD